MEAESESEVLRRAHSRTNTRFGSAVPLGGTMTSSHELESSLAPSTNLLQVARQQVSVEKQRLMAKYSSESMRTSDRLVWVALATVTSYSLQSITVSSQVDWANVIGVSFALIFVFLFGCPLYEMVIIMLKVF